MLLPTFLVAISVSGICLAAPEEQEESVKDIRTYTLSILPSEVNDAISKGFHITDWVFIPKKVCEINGTSLTLEGDLLDNNKRLLGINSLPKWVCFFFYSVTSCDLQDGYFEILKWEFLLLSFIKCTIIRIELILSSEGGKNMLNRKLLTASIIMKITGAALSASLIAKPSRNDLPSSPISSLAEEESLANRMDAVRSILTTSEWDPDIRPDVDFERLRYISLISQSTVILSPRKTDHFQGIRDSATIKASWTQYKQLILNYGYFLRTDIH